MPSKKPSTLVTALRLEEAIEAVLGVSAKVVTVGGAVIIMVDTAQADGLALALEGYTKFSTMLDNLKASK